MLERVRLAVVGDFRHGLGGHRHELRRPREVIVGEQPLEDRLVDRGRIEIARRAPGSNPVLAGGKRNRGGPCSDRPRRQPMPERAMRRRRPARRTADEADKACLRSIAHPGNESGVMYHFTPAHATPSTHENRPTSLPSAIFRRVARAPHRGRLRNPDDRAETRLLGRGDAARSGERDRVLRKLIRAHPDIHLRRRNDPFTTLARAIVGQQISVKAAESIWRRFVATVAPGASVRPFAPRSARRRRPRDVAAAAAMRPVRAQGRLPARSRVAFRLRRARSQGVAQRWTTRR